MSLCPWLINVVVNGLEARSEAASQQMDMSKAAGNNPATPAKQTICPMLCILKTPSKPVSNAAAFASAATISVGSNPARITHRHIIQPRGG